MNLLSSLLALMFSLQLNLLQSALADDSAPTGSESWNRPLVSGMGGVKIYSSQAAPVLGVELELPMQDVLSFGAFVNQTVMRPSRADFGLGFLGNFGSERNYKAYAGFGLERGNGFEESFGRFGLGYNWYSKDLVWTAIYYLDLYVLGPEKSSSSLALTVGTRF
jgi:hypothetical protein